ncbi:MAG: trypsin-like peptidase domain-containing protein, partial [Pseudomonadota bacterium]|nr:trypsin-like peptidase domain-containing protein [Pseudomonadota bacterium]
MKKKTPLFSNTPLARTVGVMDAQRAMKYFWTSSLLGVLALCLAILNSPAQAADRPDSFADLAERLSPAVVNISTSMVVKDDSRPALPRFPEGSPFEDFFKEFEDRGQARRTQSLGSGFIIDSSGIVVTNNHVIENADKISVILANDEVFEAELIGRDQKT